jgi:hypothetical protein
VALLAHCSSAERLLLVNSNNLSPLDVNISNTSDTFHHILTSHYALLTDHTNKTPSPEHHLILRTLHQQFQDHVTILLHTLQTYADNQRTLIHFIPLDPNAVPPVEVTLVSSSLLPTSSSHEPTLPPSPFPTTPPAHSNAKYYGIRVGRTDRPCIVTSWAACHRLVHQFSHAEFRSFRTFHEAETYILGPTSPRPL